MARELLFTVTAKDCDWDYFCTGGPGGQNQNKVATGCRVTHRDSGAIGESREHRTQLQNRKAAFTRMANTKEFKLWHKIETSRRMGSISNVEARVNEAMRRKNLQVDGKKDGRWVPIEEAKEDA